MRKISPWEKNKQHTQLYNAWLLLLSRTCLTRSTHGLLLETIQHRSHEKQVVKTHVMNQVEQADLNQ